MALNFKRDNRCRRGRHGGVTSMHRFLSWINSRPFISRGRSTSSVAPSLPTSSSSICEEKRSSTSSSHVPKQVHFADDCGEDLECVHVIPIQPTTGRKAFDESLEEVYINEEGVVTGFLKVSNLEPGRNVLVRYTENEWKTYKQVRAYHSEDSVVFTGNKPRKVSRYSFHFNVSRKKLSRVELVVISTLDGAIDHRHEQRYKLNNRQNYLGSVPYGHCVHCWH